jgi:hypothetical protein
MKKIALLTITFILGISILFNNCDKVDDILALPSLSAKVNTVAWTAVFTNAVMYISNDYISITGTPEISENADQLINITVNQRAEGIYEFETGTIKNDCMISYLKKAGATNGTADYYKSDIATVTITKIDTEKKTVSGTFTGTLKETSNTTNDFVRITDGKFENIPYQEIQ